MLARVMWASCDLHSAADCYRSKLRLWSRLSGTRRVERLAPRPHGSAPGSQILCCCDQGTGVAEERPRPPSSALGNQSALAGRDLGAAASVVPFSPAFLCLRPVLSLLGSDLDYVPFLKRRMWLRNRFHSSRRDPPTQPRIEEEGQAETHLSQSHREHAACRLGRLRLAGTHRARRLYLPPVRAATSCRNAVGAPALRRATRRLC